jgi:hypothetical protein
MIMHDPEYVIRTFMKVCGSQKEAAETINQSKQIFNYWLNKAKKIPFDQVIKMQNIIVEKIKSLEAEFDEYTAFQQALSQGQYLPPTFIYYRERISERAKMAMEFEHNLGQRKGRPGKSIENGSKCRLFRGKTKKFVAEKFGFSSGDTYVRAKKVILKGCLQLIDAMDKKKVSIYQASLISNFIADEQIKLLERDKTEIQALLKNRYSNHNEEE